MADGWQTYPIEFRGGLITNLSPIQQGLNIPGSARQLRNFEPSVEGGYSRILGFEKFDTNALTGTGIIRGVFYFNGKVLAVRNNSNLGGGEGELYESVGGDVGWTRVSTDSIRFTTGTGKIRFAKFNFDGTERVVMVDGTSSPIFYDGTTITQPTLTSAQEGASHVAIFKDHIFLGKDTSIISSGPLQYASAAAWSVANGAIEIQFNDTITGMEVFRDQLYIFCRTQINRVAGNTVGDFQRVPVTADIGCVEEDTIQEIGGDVIFMGPDGLRLLSGTDKIGDIGLGAVTKTIQSETTSFRNRNTSFSSVVLRNKSQYRILGYKESDPVSESKGIIGTQFASQGGDDMAWAETRGIRAYATFSAYEGTEEIILFANEDGYIYEMEKGVSFDGEDITATFYTPYLSINDPTLRKTVYILHSYIDPEGSFETDVTLDYDFNTTIRQDPIRLVNDLASDQALAVYGDSTYATWEADATANVNGAVSDSTSLVLDGGVGTIEVGQFVSGTGIIGTPIVVTVTDQNNIVLDRAQTLDDDTALSFSDHTTAQTSAIYGNAVRVKLRNQVTGSGFVVSLEYTSTSSTRPFTLDALALEYATESRR